MDNEEEFMLPSFSSSEPSLPTAPPFHNTNNRKRPFLRSREPSSIEEQLADAINTSSDPALFSSDETPDAENYEGGIKRRKKKTYEGTWWGDKLRRARIRSSQSRSNAAAKRRFERNFDSGIFMVDDSSGTDLSSEGFLDQELLNDQLNKDGTTGTTHTDDVDGLRLKSKVHRSFQLTTAAALKRMPHGRPISPKDHLIRAVVQQCLDNNDEDVDWTGMHIDYLPPAVTDLKSMIKRINSDTLNDQPAPFEAELRIYLGNNLFSQLPQPLLELTNIRLLSLRQNVFEELPPGIRALVNLEELNISSNRIRYLPYEVLKLLRYEKLTTIHESPNPWMPLPTGENRLHAVPRVMIATKKHVTLHRCIVSKPVEYLPNGAQQRCSKAQTSKQPHLSELVLRALSRHNTSKADLTSLLSEDHPVSARRLLTTLHAVQASGGRVCTFCDRDIVLPKYEWYEWWAIFHNKASRRATADSLIVLSDEPELLRAAGEFDVQAANDLDWVKPILAVSYEDMLPFQRVACGCVDVKQGLYQELRKFRLPESHVQAFLSS